MWDVHIHISVRYKLSLDSPDPIFVWNSSYVLSLSPFFYHVLTSIIILDTGASFVLTEGHLFQVSVSGIYSQVGRRADN